MVLTLIQICIIQWDIHFFCFQRETDFLGKFSPNIQICQFNLKFGTRTNSNMQNSMGMFTSSVSNGKYLFWANFVQIFKFINLTWSLVLTLTQICIVQWDIHFFCFQRETDFLGKFSPNIQICQFNLKSGAQTNSNMQNSMEMFTSSVSNGKYLFWANLVQIFKFINLTWSLVLRLIQIERIQWGCSLLLFPTGKTFFGQIQSQYTNLSI